MNLENDEMESSESVQGEIEEQEAPVELPSRSRFRVWAERLGWVAFIIGAIWGVRALQSFLLTSPVFAIETIKIEGIVRVSRDSIHKVVHEGPSIFSVDLEQARKKLIAQPWVLDAEVTRQLPSSITIRIQERKAMGVVALKDLYLFDQEGTVFKKMQPNDPSDYPVITFADYRGFLRDPAQRASTMLQVVQVIRDYESAGLSSDSINELHIKNDGNLQLSTGKQGVRVLLRRGVEHRRAFARLKTVMHRCRRDGVAPKFVFLDNKNRPDRVIVRLEHKI